MCGDEPGKRPVTSQVPAPTCRWAEGTWWEHLLQAPCLQDTSSGSWVCLPSLFVSTTKSHPPGPPTSICWWTKSFQRSGAGPSWPARSTTFVGCMNEFSKARLWLWLQFCRDNKLYFITVLTKRLRHGVHARGGNPTARSHRGWRALAARPGRRTSAGRRGRACSLCSAAPRVGSSQTRLMPGRAAKGEREHYPSSRNYGPAIPWLETTAAHILVCHGKAVFRVSISRPEKGSAGSYLVNYSLCNQFLTDKGI